MRSSAGLGSIRRRTAAPIRGLTCAKTIRRLAFCCPISTSTSRRGRPSYWIRTRGQAPRQLSEHIPLPLRGEGYPDNRIVLSVLAARPGVRAAVIASYILLVEWARALVSTAPHAAAVVLVLGGLALVLAGAGWPAGRLGLGRSHLGLRILGGLALAAVLLLPAAARASAAPILPAFLALPALVVSIGEEIAFRGRRRRPPAGIVALGLQRPGRSDRRPRHRGHRPVRRLGLLASAAVIYLLTAWMVAPGFYDGFTPQQPYNWVCPP